MPQCRCSSKHHENHPGQTCDKAAVAGDDYCKECQEKIELERADTKPERPAYQPR